MTTVCLNKKAAQQNGITIDEALLMLVIHNKANLEGAERALIQKGLIYGYTILLSSFLI